MELSARSIQKEEFETWDVFVKSSPQGTLFHTTGWNEMVSESTGENHECLYIVCENKEEWLGGMVVHAHVSKNNRIIPAPMIGFNSPFFNSSIEYQTPYKTAPGYDVFTKLLNYVQQFAGNITIKNSPEIWDVRAYSYNGWSLKTNYTHILPIGNQDEVRSRVKQSLMEKIYSEKISLHHNNQKEIPETILSLVKGMPGKEFCQVFTLINEKKEVVGQAIILLSKESDTIYLWKVLPSERQKEKDILPSLIWNLILLFKDKFNCIDLGPSSDMTISNSKDDIGGVLTPFYIAKK